MFHVKHSPLSRRWPSRSATHRLLRRRSEPLARELVAEHNDSAFWLHAFAFAVHTWHRCNRIVDDLPFERRHWNEFLAVTGFGHSPRHLVGQRRQFLPAPPSPPRDV